jgi:DNA-binding SARP family transcriptional activator
MRGDDRSPPLRIGLLGPFDLHVRDATSAVPLSRKAQWLLALVALRGGSAVERLWLAGTLWPDSEESQALYNVRRELARLRNALGPESARLRSPGGHDVNLDVTGAEVDVLAFDTAIEAGTRDALETAVASTAGRCWRAARRSGYYVNERGSNKHI